MNKRKELFPIDSVIRVLIAMILSILSVIIRENEILFVFTLFVCFLMFISGIFLPALVQSMLIIVCLISSDYLHGVFLLTMLQIIPRFLFLRMLGTSLTRTISVGEMVETLERLHLPRQILIPFTVMLRYLPTMRIEIHAIRDSLHIRGIRCSPLSFMEYLLVPILMRSVRLADELSAAAVIRGIENEEKRAWIYYDSHFEKKERLLRNHKSARSQTE